MRMTAVIARGDTTPVEATVPDARTGRIVGLDGLRAIAVLLVIVYHLAPDALPGGYVGVDTFFVVSGFLITVLLLREDDSDNRMRLPQFWMRRIRRLVPALAVVVVSCVVVAALVSRDLLVDVSRQVVGAATFTTNWLEVAAGSSYFEQGQPKLFQPFWSLAIEEQFYLLWPLTLAVLLFTTRSWALRLGLALGAAGLSAIAMAVHYRDGVDPTRLYYGTDTHGFGLMLGCALAFAWWGRLGIPATGRWGRRLPWAGLAGLLVLSLLMAADTAIPYRGGLLLATVCAAAAVAGCVAGPSGYLRLLDVRSLRWIGERSYGLYLWHWPVILLVGARWPTTPGGPGWWPSVVLILLATFGCAAASYRWVETPIRRHGFRAVARVVIQRVRASRGPQVVAGAVGVLLLGAGLAVATAPGESGAQQQIEQGDRQLAQAKPPTASPTPMPTFSPGGSARATTKPATPAPHAPTGADVSAFGDSTLSAAVPAIVTDLQGAAVNAKPIRKWSDAPALVAASSKAGTLRPAVVLAFGTNGGFKTFAGGEAAFRQTMNVIGAKRQVFVVDVVSPSSWTADYNRRLAQLAATYPNVHVVDWSSAVSGHPELLHSDRTHANLQGIKLYTKVLRAALAKTTVS